MQQVNPRHLAVLQEDRPARRTSQARQAVPSCECCAEAIQPLWQDQQWMLVETTCRACRRQTRTGSQRICCCTVEYLINYLMNAAGQSAAAALEADSSAHAAGVCPSSRKAAFSGSRYSAGSRRASSSSRTGSAFRASVFEREKTETAGRVMAEAGAPALARQTVSHELVEAASQSHELVEAASQSQGR